MSQPAAPAAAESEFRPEVDYTQEIRFAVVMYGGSSLAIYMNGVAQELLRLVRATARAREEDGGGVARAFLSDEELKGSERVYRKLGRALVRGDEGGAAGRASRAEGGGALRTRFVIDILTGTSAGGINAVYLAKALANDQNLDELMGLWRTKGDIGVLLNVPSSTRISADGRERELDFEGQPASPLNSSRMYWELLDALRGMDRQRAAPAARRRPLYAEELDLYVTATDTRGRVMNMRLADKVVQELRHRNVFHFRYRCREGEDELNDFKADYNPFLAFAARCTSAHQAAFEVMNMEAASGIIKGTDTERPEELRFKDPGLQKFYEEYLAQAGNVKLWRRKADGKLDLKDGKPVPLTGKEVEEIRAKGMLREKLAEDFFDRYFNDGGTLDNSPFSFVSDVLPFRETLHPVDRKLLYVEPSPEHPDEDDAGNLRWNFVKNALEGLSTLPSYQTIVEDLDRIRARNNLIERVNHILADLRDDIGARNAAYGGRWPPVRSLEAMRRTKLSDLIQEKGVSWGGYQRLRIAQVTNDLTLLISRAGGIDEESEEFQAVRYLVRRWRLSRYEDHGGQGGASSEGDAAGVGKAPEMGFLVDFDLSWTVRRVQFLLRTIDELDCLDGAARRIVEITGRDDLKPTWPEGESQEEEFREELRRVRRGVNRVYAGLRDARRRFWARRDDTASPNPFRDEVDGLAVPKSMLLGLLRQPGEQARLSMIADYLGKKEHADAFAKLAAEVRSRFGEELRAARWALGRLLRYPRRGGALGAGESVRYVLAFYYRFFEDFDQVTFPIFYSTDVGEETDPIEVFRVSPEDACLLVDEKDVNAKRAARNEGRISKLAGTAVGHFGAFFDERYRVNDILWGRLDGAERIISAMLPGADNSAQREGLVREAHEAIILETFGKVMSDLAAKDASLAREIAQTPGRAPDSALKEAGVPALWRRFLFIRAGAGGVDAVEAFKRAFLESYEEERHFPWQRKAGLLGGGLNVLRKIIHANIREGERGQGPLLRALTGLALFIVGLVTLPLGAYKFIVGLLRFAFSPLRKVIDRVSAGNPR